MKIIFTNKFTCRPLNTTKSLLGKISKYILVKVSLKGTKYTKPIPAKKKQMRKQQ